MVTLHIANKNYSSWSLRPWVLMKTLGIAFMEEVHPFDGADNAERFRSFSPSGRVPCLVDGDIAVWDSLAIAEYLAESLTNVWPADKAARAWARCVAAEMHSSFFALRNACGMSCGVRVALKEHSAALAADIGRITELWNEGLLRFGGPFLAGDRFTAVDAFFAPVTFRALTYGLDFGDAGNAYAAMIRDLPAMREWY
ncbi:glutathione S-transferase family protein, partial [Salmonella enterica subsp. enterica serovar Virchow]|nr:glutathione S-transferase family protein [Salmonella enterica subsp. enterica serovar Virchow]